MGAVTIQQMAARISTLLTDRLRIKGGSLGEKLSRSGRSLPRKVSQAAEALNLAAEQSHNPKLLLQIDEEAVAANYDICMRYLGPLNKGDRIWGAMLSLSVSILFSLLAVAALVVGVLVWRGFI
jgi:hypothetical protein